MPTHDATCNPTSDSTDDARPAQLDRRSLFVMGGIGATAAVAAPLARRALLPHADVFIAREQKYDGPLRQTIRDGLLATGFDLAKLRTKRVLLKPNLVEPDPKIPYMTTHPAVVCAAAEVFLEAGCKVTVGEAPGHIRDTGHALIASGLGDALRELKVRFADLNYEAFAARPNRGGNSDLATICFPQTVLEADLVVSMPKMKTHHWVGVTASMKNLYGTLPGVRYGWPKNVLHHNGIPETVVDIAASLPQTAAIVDGIDCMEGDGPILGTRKKMGLIVVGQDLTAVDATVVRAMSLRPEQVDYLRLAADRLGPIAESRITQRGERWQDVCSPFAVLDEPHLRRLRSAPDGPLVT